MPKEMQAKSIAEFCLGRRPAKWLVFFVAVASVVVGQRPVSGQNQSIPLCSGVWFLERLAPYHAGERTFASDVSSNGDVSGTVYYDGSKRAFLWRRLSERLDLPANQGSGNALNDSLEVVGFTDTSGPSYEAQAFVWYNWQSNGVIYLPGSYGRAMGINYLGEVVGAADEFGTGRRAFLWRQGTAVYLGTLGGYVSEAQGINDHGEVAGWSELPEPTVHGTIPYHAFRYSDGVMVDAGALPGSHNSYARRINNAGQMVGASDFHDGSAGHVWHACLWNKGTAPLDLDPAGVESEALDINNHGVIVGRAKIGGTQRAVRWKQDPGTGKYVMLDLNSVLPAGSNFLLYEATGINDTGQIAGTGIANGTDYEAFLLTPVNVKYLTFGTYDVVGGSSLQGAVMLTNAPPVNVAVPLIDSHPAATAPASVTIQAGKLFTWFPLNTVGVSSSTTGLFEASLGSSMVYCTGDKRYLTVRPPGVRSVVLRPNSVPGTLNAEATVTLEGPAGPGGVAVGIASSLPAVAWPAMPSITIAKGLTSGTVLIRTAYPSKATSPGATVSITAWANGYSRSATLLVQTTTAVR